MPGHIGPHNLPCWPAKKPPTDQLNLREAMVALGVSWETLKRLLQEGIIPYYEMPGRNKMGRPIKRISLEAITKYKQEHTGRRTTFKIDPRYCEQIPESLFARILGCSEHAAHVAVQNKMLPDRKPESVYNYILKRGKREARKDARKHYKKLIRSKDVMIWLARRERNQARRERDELKEENERLRAQLASSV